LTEGERQEIFCQFISPLDDQLQRVLDSSQAWVEIADPWLDDSDVWNLRRVWEERNVELREIWERVKKTINHPNDRSEMRLDDISRDMLTWIQQDYKILPDYWKNPTVTLKGFDGPEALLQLSYYVDNIRLEHDERASRIHTEIGRQVRDFLHENGVWG
jgi:MscS family membrane protein